MTLLLVIGAVVFIVLLILLGVFAGSEPHPFEYLDIPEPAPDTPVFPPLGADGDRDAEEPAIEPDWQTMWERGKERGLTNSDWQDELRAYHSHLCPCPACTDELPGRQSRLIQWFIDGTKA